MSDTTKRDCNRLQAIRLKDVEDWRRFQQQRASEEKRNKFWLWVIVAFSLGWAGFLAFLLFRR